MLFRRKQVNFCVKLKCSTRGVKHNFFPTSEPWWDPPPVPNHRQVTLLDFFNRGSRAAHRCVHAQLAPSPLAALLFFPLLVFVFFRALVHATERK